MPSNHRWMSEGGNKTPAQIWRNEEISGRSPSLRNVARWDSPLARWLRSWHPLLAEIVRSARSVRLLKTILRMTRVYTYTVCMCSIITPCSTSSLCAPSVAPVASGRLAHGAVRTSPLCPREQYPVRPDVIHHDQARYSHVRSRVTTFNIQAVQDESNNVAHRKYIRVPCILYPAPPNKCELE